MALFIANQTTPPRGDGTPSDTMRMIVEAENADAAMEAFRIIAEPDRTIQLIDETPDQSWVQEQKQGGKLRLGEAQPYMVPFK